MIKTNMLQLGDYVLSGKDKKVSIIASLNNDFVLLDYPDNDGYYFESKEKYLEPILITEDLLEKIGFEKSDFKFISNRRVYTKRIGDNSFEYEFTEEGKRVVMMRLTFNRYSVSSLQQSIFLDIDYLHELQQIVRLVTKKELTIKL